MGHVPSVAPLADGYNTASNGETGTLQRKA